MIVKTKFDVTGMTCSACSQRVENAVKKLDGINEVSVNLLTNSMNADYNSEVLSEANIIDAVIDAGYGASIKGIKKAEASIDSSKIESDNAKRRVIYSFVFLIPLMYIAMGEMMGLPLPSFLAGHKNAISFALTQFLLTLPIIYLNQHYYKNGLRALFKRSPNMDSLVAIGSLAALIYGIFAIYRMAYGFSISDMEIVSNYHMDLYFESAGTIVTLISLGKYLEAKSKKKTSESLRKLMELSPKTAFVERNGQVVEVDISEVNRGDILHVRPGQSIPTDGVVIEGFSYVDESIITGESMLVEKAVNDNLIGATINQNGYIKMKATKVGGETTFSQIIKLVEDASATKAPIAKMADKVAGIFVPTVISIAIVTGIVWWIVGGDFEFALSMAITVVVISCPCALGLATPVAIMVGTGKGAELGILIKSGDALERAHSIRTVILDKTGTITEGKPKVASIITTNISEEELVKIAYSLELKSEHPLGKAIISHANEMKLEPYDIREFTNKLGRGISGYIEENSYYIGNKKLFDELGISVINIEGMLSENYVQGSTPIYIAREEECIGVILVADQIKENSDIAIKELRRMNIEVVMLTGDNELTAKSIASKLELNRVIAEVLPKDKEAVVREYMEKGKVVAMVGDGINDAPALVTADVGIAIGNGTDIAIESADIILMRSDLLGLVDAIRLSRAVIRNIKQNLFWAFFYNILGIPLAAGALYIPLGLKLTPMFGSFAMSFSSLFVVGNALRLKLFKGKLMNEAVQKAEFIVNNEDERKEEERMVLKIEGMMCGHCVAHVEKALGAIDGVSSVIVDLEGKSATVTGENLSKEVLEKAVIDAGYQIL